MPKKGNLKMIEEIKNQNIDVIKDKLEKHESNNYICYCFDSKTHLCNECLNTRIHMIIEIII